MAYPMLKIVIRMSAILNCRKLFHNSVFRYADNMRMLMMSIGIMDRNPIPQHVSSRVKSRSILVMVALVAKILAMKMQTNKTMGGPGLQESRNLVLCANQFRNLLIHAQQAFCDQTGKGQLGEDRQAADQKRTVQYRIEPG